VNTSTIKVLRRPVEFTLAAPIAVMYQLGEVAAGSAPGPDAHLEGVEGEIGVQARGELPAHDAAAEDVDHECGVDPSGERADIRGRLRKGSLTYD
jgi:hypothetical protein